ncbi:hypothetical protein Adt_42220 [Abeliophyllum distichum]|uniref:Uncharacterized protein n=1 Tax=Abeliophyllum distichum TaxID=126358 RepID=A0ABD1PR15_9LAMI
MVGEAYPRILKWKTGAHVSGLQLEEEVFKHSELEVIQFVAINEEKNEIYALGLFHKKQSANECGASSSRFAIGEKGQVEDQNPKRNVVDFDISNNENIGHGATDFEFDSRMSSDHEQKMLKLGRRKEKRVQVDKTNNESGTEFEVGGEESKKYLFDGTFVSKHRFDVLKFCPSFDLGIDDEPNANDIELDDMEFTKYDLKMIDECDVDVNDDYILVNDSTPDIPRKA